VPAALFALEFMYNDKTYGSKPPTKLADFFDPVKFPGKRVIFGKDATIGVFEAALMGDGVAPDALYPLDIDRALNVYNRIRPSLTLAQTYAQQQQIMVDNQADMALVVSARAYSVLNAGGTQWKPVWDQIPITWDTLVIPKGSPNTELSTQLIKFASQPEQAAKFAELSGAGAANTAAKPQLNDLQKQVDAFAPELAANRHFIDADWWTEHYAEMVEKWSNWQIG
jgi:putative spermidine/putrescine transport system substrate-binding protein